MILNAKNIENEESIVREALKEIGTGLVQYIPRSQDIQTAEAGGGTVFQVLDASPMCGVYNELADKILTASGADEQSAAS